MGTCKADALTIGLSLMHKIHMMGFRNLRSYKLIFVLSFFMIPGWTLGQDNTDSLNYNVGVEAVVGSGDYVPTALVNNRHGVIDPKEDALYMRGAMAYKHEASGGFAMETGLDMLFCSTTKSKYYSNNVRLQQLYLDLKYKKMGLSVGVKEEQPMLVDYNLSSGNMIWSENSRPIPRVKVGTTDYVNLFKWLQLYADCSYGKMLDGDFNRDYYVSNPKYHYTPITEGTYLHRKNLFVRTNPNAKFVFTFGAEHLVQFAGKLDGRVIEADFKQFANAFFAKNSNGGNENTQTLSWDLKTTYNNSSFSVDLYLQKFNDYIEDEWPVSYNGYDGLWGIQFTAKKNDIIKKTVFEYLQTSNQEGPLYVFEEYKYGKIDEFISMSTYYNDQLYGPMAHYGLAFGNPMLKSPIYNKDNAPLFLGTLQKTYRLGLEGFLSQKLQYRLVYTNTTTWGEPFALLPEKQTNNSLLATLNYKHKSFCFSLSGALDSGKIYGNNTGFMISVTKCGNLLK